MDVARGFLEELRTGRLTDDIVASLFRVTTGFGLAVLFGIPVGLWLGNHARARTAFLPLVNFFRSLSPLAWIPFAILWFGIGENTAVGFSSGPDSDGRDTAVDHPTLMRRSVQFHRANR